MKLLVMFGCILVGNRWSYIVKTNRGIMKFHAVVQKENMPQTNNSGLRFSCLDSYLMFLKCFSNFLFRFLLCRKMFRVTICKVGQVKSKKKAQISIFSYLQA